MHVVMIAASRFPLKEPFAGGLESLTWHLCRGLRANGIRVSVFAGCGSDPQLGARELHTRPLDLSAAARQDVAMPPAVWLSEHHAYLQVMLELQRRGDVDVIHNNSLHHLPVAMAAACRAPMVTTLHTPPTPWLEPAIEIADSARSRYVAVSEHTRQAWRHVVDADVVPNGVDVRRWRPGPGGGALAWAGRLVPEKAPHLAIDIARAAGLRLRLAGPVGDDDYVRDMVQPRLGPDVEYLGHLRTDELGTLFGEQRRHAGDPGVGRAVRPRRRRVPGLRHAGRGVRARRPAGVRDVRGRPGRRRPTTSVPRRMPCAGRSSLDRGACRAHAVQHCSVGRMVDAYLRLYDTMRALRGAA